MNILQHTHSLARQHWPKVRYKESAGNVGKTPRLRFFCKLANIEAVKAALIEARAARAASEARTAEVEAELAFAKAVQSDGQALILHLQLEIEKLKRRLYGVNAERGARLALD